jgi:hypothetical protein
MVSAAFERITEYVIIWLNVAGRRARTILLPNYNLVEPTSRRKEKRGREKEKKQLGRSGGRWAVFDGNEKELERAHERGTVTNLLKVYFDSSQFTQSCPTEKMHLKAR